MRAAELFPAVSKHEQEVWPALALHIYIINLHSELFNKCLISFPFNIVLAVRLNIL